MVDLPWYLNIWSRDQLSRLCVVESFSANPDWARVLAITVAHPNLESGMAFLSFMERGAENPTWSGAYLSRTDAQTVSVGFAACLFAHIKDEISIQPLDWTNWMGDTRLYHLNHNLHCGIFLARAKKPYMDGEWKNVATFTANKHLRDLAQEVLSTSEGCSCEQEFSADVAAVRRCYERVRRVTLGDEG